MSGTITQAMAPFQTKNLDTPAKAVVFSTVISLTGATFPLALHTLSGVYPKQVQGAFVDNSAGTASCVLTTTAGDAKSIPPGFQGTMPIYIGSDDIIYLTGNGSVRITLLNFPAQMAVWSASGSEGTVTISGTVPVSAASLPLPTGASTAANQTPPVSAGGSAALATPVQGIAGGTAIPISATSLPLPTGAATAANQIAPVSAGTNSTSGTPIQGIQGGVLVPTGASATIISQAPAVTSAVYSAGYCMGGLLSFTSATRAGSEAGLLQSVKVTFASGIQPSLDFIGFTTSPTASTITDHTALAIAGADLTKTLPAVHLTDVVSLGTPTQVQAVQQALEFVLGTGSTLYGCIVQRTSAGVTPGSTSDMAVNVAIIQQ